MRLQFTVRAGRLVLDRAAGDYGALARSRAIPRVDGGEPVWSVVCFFVEPESRGHGVPAGLLGTAVAYAAAEGARTVEAYPRAGGPSYFYLGTRELCEAAGLVEAACGARATMRLPSKAGGRGRGLA